MPIVDISETDSEYLIKAELPEVKKEDVKVTVEHGVLTIQGERRHRWKKRGGNFTASNALTAALCEVSRCRNRSMQGWCPEFASSKEREDQT